MIEDNYMDIQEKLSKLFDGELDDGQAQEVMNEIAENSDLQGLYLEQKTLHSYMQNPYLPETEGLKEGILKQIKLDTKSIRIYQTRKYIARAAMVGLFLLSLGGYLWYTNGSIFDNGLDKVTVTESAKFDNVNVSHNNTNGAAKREIPVVKQTNLDTKNTNKDLALNNSKKSSNGYSKKYNSNRRSENTTNANVTTNVNNVLDVTNNQIKLADVEKPLLNFISLSNLFADTKVASEAIGSHPRYYLNPVYNYKTALILERLSMQFNWYGLSKSSPNFTPKNSKTGILNDFSLFLMYSLTDKTSVGVSFGYDNFLMQYNGWEGNTQYQYKQEYSTPWIGCNINHRFEPILTFADYYEVSPIIQLNTAYANVGVYTQASVGVDIGISAKTSLLVGFNSGWLFYKYENIEYTNKNGLSIGLKYGF